MGPCQGPSARPHKRKPPMRLLLVEDDPSVATCIARGLTEAGDVCDVLTHGTDGLFRATRESYDVLVVDRMLPGLDGLSLVRALRAAGGKAPVLFLTALGGIDDRVEGLEAGGDDYLTKPFAFCRTDGAGQCPGPQAAGAGCADRAARGRSGTGHDAPAGAARRAICCPRNSPCRRC